MPGTAERPADIYLAPGSAHGLQRGDLQAGWGACVDAVQCGLTAASHQAQSSAETLRAAWDRKLGRAAPPQHLIHPLPFTTMGSFYEPGLRPCLAAWAALRAADADAGDGAAGGVAGAERLVGARWLPRMSVAAHRGTAHKLELLLADFRASEGGVQRSDYVGAAAATAAWVGAE